MPRPNAVLSQCLSRVESFTHRIDTITALYRISWQATAERLFLHVPSELFSKEGRGGGEERRGRAEASCTPTHQFIQPASCRANFVGLLPTLVRANNGSARRARGFLTKGRIRAKLGSKVASMLDDGDGEDGVEGRRAQGREGGYLVRFRLRRVRSEAEETTRQHVIAPCSTLGCR